MSVVVRVENVSKKYQLGKVGTHTLRGDLQRWWARQRGREDPFAKVGQVHRQAGSDFWALRDVSFDINQGEAIGIIGKNGAGKSTLLKILSRITLPTAGRIRIRGRVASLLEVGTGFNPELTGRENIYLNGAILGMSKREVARKFDEIVDFSGVEQFIDTPVKRYSSGMYVRLAFAVAAYLESEILILDEVLAVGDAEFQKKCLGKMDDVAHNQGRTVIFVSHGLDAVKKLCNKALLLEKGICVAKGDTDHIIQRYVDADIKTKIKDYYNNDDFEQGNSCFIEAFITNQDDYRYSQSIDLCVRWVNRTDMPNLRVGVAVLNKSGTVIVNLSPSNEDMQRLSGKGNYELLISFETGLFLPDDYDLILNLYSNNSVHHFVEPAMRFSILRNEGNANISSSQRAATAYTPSKIYFHKSDHEFHVKVKTV